MNAMKGTMAAMQLETYGMSLFHRPFLGVAFLRAPVDLFEGGSGAVFEERDGVHYIRQDILNGAGVPLKGLDMDFKNLIDSILR
jgi:hypothetical protein